MAYELVTVQFTMKHETTHASGLIIMSKACTERNFLGQITEILLREARNVQTVVPKFEFRIFFLQGKRLQTAMCSLDNI